MYEQLGYCAALFFLGYLSRQDIKTKFVSVKVIWIFGAVAFLYLCWGQGTDVGVWIIRIIPGTVLWLLAWVTKESIGYGDGAAVMVLGLWCGTLFCILILCLGIFLSGVYALCRMAAGRFSPVPFIPFLLISMEVILFYA